MKERYEIIHLLVITAWLVTRDATGYLIILPFIAVILLGSHIIVTQKYYHHSSQGKDALFLRVFHYTTLALVYLCIVIHFIWELINVIYR